MKKILIHSLLKTYSYLTIGIIIFFASLIAYSNYQSYLRQVSHVEQEVADSLAEELNYYHWRLKNELYQYGRDSNKLQGISEYFNLSPADYQLWLMKHPLAQIVNLSLHRNISQLYLNNDFIEGIAIAPVDGHEVFVSTKIHKSGYNLAAADYRAPKNAFSIPLYEPATLEVFATVFVSIDSDRLDKLVKSETDMPLGFAIIKSRDSVFYQRDIDGKDVGYQRQIFNDWQVTVAVAQSYIWIETLRSTLYIFLAASLLIWILLWLLNRVFAEYQNQIMDLVASMQAITLSDKQLRIDTNSKKQELYLIANQINQMLDALEKHISQIYQLELAQQEANMKTLQAQINPHFLYNTLEFFRMYAVTKNQEELADMIYEFSSLLRGCISQKKETTIAEELAFCEKHSFICQMRYPRSIAYAYQIDEGCQQFVLPRFSIQPLVENYFIHGIDLTKRNNAISVKVLRSGDDVTILIRDNGKGMTEEVLHRYQGLLEQRELILDSGRSSIGILNVHQRFLLYFGEKYNIQLDKSEEGGLTYTIHLKGILKGKEYV